MVKIIEKKFFTSGQDSESSTRRKKKKRKAFENIRERFLLRSPIYDEMQVQLQFLTNRSVKAKPKTMSFKKIFLHSSLG